MLTFGIFLLFLLCFIKDMLSVGISCLFGLVVPECVVDPVLDGIWEILLGYIMIGIIMGIEIMLPFYFCIGAVAVLILQMARGSAAFLCAYVLKSGVNCRFC